MKYGDESPDLGYKATNSLTLNEGTIQNSETVNADLTLPSPGATGSLSANKDLVIDWVSPTITNITSTTANGIYGIGDVIVIETTFSEDLVYLGDHRVYFEIGENDAFSGNATLTGNKVTVSYTVEAGHQSNDLTVESVWSAETHDAAVNLIDGRVPNGKNLSDNKDIVIDGVIPTISSIDLSEDNAFVDITFSESVFNTEEGIGALALDAFDLSLSGGTAHTPEVTSVSTTAGEGLAGGEITVRVNFSTTGTADGSETLQVDLVATAVYDVAGNAADADQTANNTVTLNDKALPTISSLSLASNNSYVDVTFSEAVYGDTNGALETGDFILLLSGGTATSPVVTSVSTTAGEGLSGGETTVRVNFSTTGTGDGTETLEVDLAAAAVSDAVGNEADADQTSNNTVTLIDLIPNVTNVTSS
ncbi:MAG: glycoside hydrolase family 32 protein, partial [Roseivirga sp.]|nr:glycoside hydrolase family 32 protein [Roseivirga sp.]